jgi:hypothetical protein
MSDIAGPRPPGDTDEFARRELEGFFRRHDEQGKAYCAACLAEQLAREGTRGIFPATWLATIENAFERPQALHVDPRGTCVVCEQSRPCIGVPLPRRLPESP